MSVLFGHARERLHIFQNLDREAKANPLKKEMAMHFQGDKAKKNWERKTLTAIKLANIAIANALPTALRN